MGRGNSDENGAKVGARRSRLTRFRGRGGGEFVFSARLTNARFECARSNNPPALRVPAEPCGSGVTYFRKWTKHLASEAALVRSSIHRSVVHFTCKLGAKLSI